MNETSRFFFPGPTWVRPEILAEMTRPMVPHRSSAFHELFASVTGNLKRLFLTKQHAFIASSSGTGLLEASLMNCVRRRVLITTCGAFSERWLTIAQQLGVEVDILEHPWGEAVNPEGLANHLSGRRSHYDAVTFTHNETSTGLLNDLETLARVVRGESEDTLVLVDAVSSLAGAPIRFDEWDLDVCLASVQKGLALPPGITVFAVSDRALSAAAEKKHRGTYFDFLDYRKNAEGSSTPFTPAVSLFYALDLQLKEILEVEGLEQRWMRHRKMREVTMERTSAYARPMVEAAHASPTVSALQPITHAPAAILAAMKARGYTLGSGYGKWKESTFRIGHMGDISLQSLEAMLDDLAKVISELNDAETAQ